MQQLTLIWESVLPYLERISSVNKSSDVTLIYAGAAAAALLIFLGYSIFARRKSGWMVVLFGCIAVVNGSYLALALSASLEEALWANRAAYLGSVFLPLAMCMVIRRAVGARRRPLLPWLLGLLALAVLALAASPGYLDLYYKEVSYQVVNGAASLAKTYGALHPVYFIYLFGYSIGTLVLLAKGAKKKSSGSSNAGLYGIAVLVNMSVWLIEQLVHLQFELLSISYIISALFLLAAKQPEKAEEPKFAEAAPAEEEVLAPSEETPEENADSRQSMFLQGLATLTPTERRIYDLYVSGATTKEVLESLGIKENTLKFHNKNLYSKLGVSSRKQLLELQQQTEKSE